MTKEYIEQLKSALKKCEKENENRPTFTCEVIVSSVCKSARECIAELEKQIEKMKNCGNCKYGYCGGSSMSIDKDGNRTFHNWNEEKQAYCDIGKNGKYQCWEIKENE